MSLMPRCEKPFTWWCVLAFAEWKSQDSLDEIICRLRGGCHWALWIWLSSLSFPLASKRAIKNKRGEKKKRKRRSADSK